MSASQIQLSAKGLQDEIITGSPELTYFRMRFSNVKHYKLKSKEIPFYNTVIGSGNFQICDIKSHGDIIRSFIIKIILPSLYKTNTPSTLCYPVISYSFSPVFYYLDSSYDILYNYEPNKTTLYYNTSDPTWIPDICILNNDIFSFTVEDTRVKYIGFDTLEYANFWGFVNFINFKKGRYIFNFNSQSSIRTTGWVQSYFPYFREYISDAGIKLIKSIELYIGGQLIEKIPSDYILIYNDIQIPENQKESVNRLNESRGVYSTSDIEYYINVPCTIKNIPICALERQDVKIQVEFNDLESVIDPDSLNVTGNIETLRIPEQNSSNTCIFTGKSTFSIINSSLYENSNKITTLLPGEYNTSCFDGNYIYTCRDPFLQRINITSYNVDTFNLLESGGFSSSKGLSYGGVNYTDGSIQILDNLLYRNYIVPFINISNVFNVDIFTDSITYVVTNISIFEFKTKEVKINQKYQLYPYPKGELPISFGSLSSTTYYLTSSFNIYNLNDGSFIINIPNAIQLHYFNFNLYVLTKNFDFFLIDVQNKISRFIRNIKSISGTSITGTSVSKSISSLNTVNTSEVFRLLILDNLGDVYICDPINLTKTIQKLNESGIIENIYFNRKFTALANKTHIYSINSYASEADLDKLKLSTNVKNITPSFTSTPFITDDGTNLYFAANKLVRILFNTQNNQSLDTSPPGYSTVPPQMSNNVGFDGTYVYTFPRNGSSNIFLYNVKLPFESNSSHSYITVTDRQQRQQPVYHGASASDGSYMYIWPNNQMSSNIMLLSKNQTISIFDLSTSDFFKKDISNVYSALYLNNIMYTYSDSNNKGVIRRLKTNTTSISLSKSPSELNSINECGIYEYNREIYVIDSNPSSSKNIYKYKSDDISAQLVDISTSITSTPTNKIDGNSNESIFSLVQGTPFVYVLPNGTNNIQKLNLLTDSKQNIRISGTDTCNTAVQFKTSNIYFFTNGGTSNVYVLTPSAGQDVVSTFKTPRMNVMSSAVLGDYIILTDETSNIYRYDPRNDPFIDQSGYSFIPNDMLKSTGKVHMNQITGNAIITNSTGGIYNYNAISNTSTFTSTPPYTHVSQFSNTFIYCDNQKLYYTPTENVSYFGKTISSMSASRSNVFISFNDSTFGTYDITSNNYYNIGYISSNAITRHDKTFLVGLGSSIYYANTTTISIFRNLNPESQPVINIDRITANYFPISSIITTSSNVYIGFQRNQSNVQQISQGTLGTINFPSRSEISNCIMSTSRFSKFINDTARDCVYFASKESNLFFEYDEVTLVSSNIAFTKQNSIIPFEGNTFSNIFTRGTDLYLVPYKSNSIFRYDLNYYTFNGVDIPNYTNINFSNYSKVDLQNNFVILPDSNNLDKRRFIKYGGNNLYTDIELRYYDLLSDDEIINVIGDIIFTKNKMCINVNTGIKSNFIDLFQGTELYTLYFDIFDLTINRFSKIHSYKPGNYIIITDTNQPLYFPPLYDLVFFEIIPEPFADYPVDNPVDNPVGNIVDILSDNFYIYIIYDDTNVPITRYIRCIKYNYEEYNNIDIFDAFISSRQELKRLVFNRDMRTPFYFEFNFTNIDILIPSPTELGFYICIRDTLYRSIYYLDPRQPPGSLINQITLPSNTDNPVLKNFIILSNKNIITLYYGTKYYGLIDTTFNTHTLKDIGSNKSYESSYYDSNNNKIYLITGSNNETYIVDVNNFENSSILDNTDQFTNGTIISFYTPENYKVFIKNNQQIIIRPNITFGVESKYQGESIRSNTCTIFNDILYMFPGLGSPRNRIITFGLAPGNRRYLNTIITSPDVQYSAVFNGNLVSMNTTSITYYNNTQITRVQRYPILPTIIYGYTLQENSFIVLNTDKGTFHASNNQNDVYLTPLLSNISFSSLSYRSNIYISNGSVINFYSTTRPPLTITNIGRRYTYLFANTQTCIGMNDNGVFNISGTTHTQLGSGINKPLVDYIPAFSNIYTLYSDGTIYNAHRNVQLLTRTSPVPNMTSDDTSIYFKTLNSMVRVPLTLNRQTVSTIPIILNGSILSYNSNIFTVDNLRFEKYDSKALTFVLFPNRFPRRANVFTSVSVNDTTLYMFPDSDQQRIYNFPISSLNDFNLTPARQLLNPLFSNITAASYNSETNSLWMISSKNDGKSNVISFNIRGTSAEVNEVELPFGSLLPRVILNTNVYPISETRTLPLTSKIKHMLYNNKSVFFGYQGGGSSSGLSSTVNNGKIRRQYFSRFIDGSSEYFMTDIFLNTRPQPVRNLITDGRIIYTASNIVYSIDSFVNTYILPINIVVSNIRGNSGYFDGRFLNMVSNSIVKYDTLPITIPRTFIVSTLVNYAYISESDRMWLRNHILDYIVTQIQISKFKVTNIDGYYSIDFKGPVREVLFKIDKGYIESLSLFLNGHLKHTSGNNYISNVSFQTNHSRAPDTTGLYNISFGNNPELKDSSGHINMSRIREKVFNIKVSNIESQVTVYGLNYNVLRIQDGLGGLVFYDSI